MKYPVWLFYILLYTAATVTPSFGGNLDHKLERNAIVAGTAIRLNAGKVRELAGTKGIVMDTCRQLPGRPLVLEGRDKRSYRLPDGVYENRQGLRIHVRRGGIERISVSPRAVR